MMNLKPNALLTHSRDLGIKNGDRIWIGGHHLAAKKLAYALFYKTYKPTNGPLDYVIITPNSADEAVYFAEKLRDRLSINGKIWVVVKDNPGIETETGSPATDRVIAESILAELSRLGFQPAEDVRLNSDFLAIGFKATCGTSLRD